jgi:hypothetical protein
MVCTNDNYSKPPVFDRGEKAAEHFFDDMFNENVDHYVCLCDSKNGWDF